MCSQKLSTTLLFWNSQVQGALVLNRKWKMNFHEFLKFSFHLLSFFWYIAGYPGVSMSIIPYLVVFPAVAVQLLLGSTLQGYILLCHLRNISFSASCIIKLVDVNWIRKASTIGIKLVDIDWRGGGQHYWT